MKKVFAIVLSLVMVFTAFSVIGASAVETSQLTYSDHLTNNSNTGYDYDVTNASIAWVKQANGVLVWVAADDTRGDDAIIAQAKAADPSLGHKNEFAVLRGFGTTETPNKNGSQTTVTVSVFGRQTILSIQGKYSHFVGGYFGPAVVEDEPEEEPAEEPTELEIPDEEPTEPEAAEGDTGTIRIDVPLKMAVAFSDGTVYYGGEMKEVVFGQEYTFQMCAVNWDNGTFDQNGNGIAGTVVYRMTVVHRDKFLRLARAAKEDTARYTIKGIDIIDNVAKTIIVNGNAEDTHLETDVNNFFMAYRFNFTNEDSDKMTGIDGVTAPVNGLSVNLPLGSTITCNAYAADELAATDNVFITNNSGVGVYDDVYLTSVNDYTWAI